MCYLVLGVRNDSAKKMFSSRNGQVAAVLLLAVMKNFVFASFNTNETMETWGRIVTSMQVPWIDGIQSAIGSAESPCAEEIAVLSEAISAHEMWALKMLDASSKIQSGILQGNLVDLGMYDQCVAVDGGHNGVNVRGQHCMVTLGYETLRMSSSVCLPSSCNETQAIHIVSYVMKNFLLNNSLEIETTAASCARIESEEFIFVEILTIVFFSAVGVFVLVGTICDFVKRCFPKKISADAVNTLAKFSIYTNALEIFSTQIKPGTILAVNGIRFMSICWIVILHQYGFTRKGPMINSFDSALWFNSWTAVWVRMATFATDNFFLVSGFLMSFLFFKSMRSGRKFNLPMMYLHRYIRLTPGIAVVTLFVTFLFHRIGNGPLWKTLNPVLLSDCRENWWINLLYMQNFSRISNICLGYSWFLAADMQLFWMSPIISYPLHRWPKYGLGILTLFSFTSIVAGTLAVGLNNTSIVQPFNVNTESLQTFAKYYIRPYTRAFPYLLGILLGYDIATNKRRLTQVAVIFNWIVTCIFMVLCFLAIRHLSKDYIEYNLAFETMCAALLRPCWSIAMGWVIYACTQGYGGVAARFLSLPIFLPLSRLSYGIYLVHTPVRVFRMSSAVILGRLGGSQVLDSFLGDLVLSMGVSCVISLFFEYPVMVLDKILKNKTREPEPVKQVQNVELEEAEGIQDPTMPKA